MSWGPALRPARKDRGVFRESHRVEIKLSRYIRSGWGDAPHPAPVKRTAGSSAARPCGLG